MAVAPAPAIHLPILILAVANAVLFALGAALHIGIDIVPIEEPMAAPVTALEGVAAALFILAVLGIFTATTWSRKLARFANIFAIVAVAAIAMLLSLDGERSAAPMKSMQVLRVVFASVSLLMLYHNGREQSVR